ncbi:MAG: class I SAM-dependent methyltransferase [Bacteroidia bacterium]
MKEQEWFESWFNSPYYHILYKNRDEIEAAFFINNITQKIHLNPNDKVLDIACGKGRHSIIFNKLGFFVNGIDISSESIKEAQKHANPTLQFYVHDMRKLFRINYYNLAVNLFSSFGYFKTEKEHQQAINNMYKCLKPGGYLIIDFLNAFKVINKLVPAEEKIIDNIHFKIERNFFKGNIIKSIEVTDGDKKYNFVESVKAFTFKDFELFLKRAGLQIINVYGDYALNPYNEIESDRLILFAQK